MVDLQGIQYLFTVPVGIALGFAIDLPIALAFGATWWLIAAPVLGLIAGLHAGSRMH